MSFNKIMTKQTSTSLTMEYCVTMKRNGLLIYTASSLNESLGSYIAWKETSKNYGQDSVYLTILQHNFREQVNGCKDLSMVRVLKVRVKEHGKGLESGGHYKGARRKGFAISKLF